MADVLRQIRCDLHMHSALSPCADDDMTPGNIVGISMLNGLDVIAITDHQSCGNCAPAIAIAEAMGSLVVIPGLEVESSEEIHLVCLLPDVLAAQAIEQLVRQSMPPQKNRVDIFGEQCYFNEDDEIIGHEEQMLLLACGLSCDEIARAVQEVGGACLPAHIDREANSMLSTLGAIPEEFPLTWFELSHRARPPVFFQAHPELQNIPWLTSSDAHRLGDIADPGWPLTVESWQNPDEARRHVLQALRQKTPL